ARAASTIAFDLGHDFRASFFVPAMNDHVSAFGREAERDFST
ncbi:MAG: hypothetical protein ACI84D_002964, partial [Thalassolituus oleivorans]